MNKYIKIIKSVCAAISIVSLMIIIGVMGSFENDAVTAWTFIKTEIICIALFFMALKAMDKLERIKNAKKN